MARLAGALADHLRQAYLVSVAPDLVALPETERPQVVDLAKKMGLASVVRHMEVLGKAQVDMREAPDARVHLEVVLIRLTHPEADDSPAALLERIERLERSQGDGGPVDPRPDPPPPPAKVRSERRRPEKASSEPARPTSPLPPAPAPADPPVTAESSSPEDPVSGPELARRTLGALPPSSSGGRATTRAAPSPRPPAAVHDAPSALAGTTKEVSRDTLVELWGDSLLASLPNRARARFRVGRFIAVHDGTAVFALPNETHRSYCEEVRLDVEAALGDHFGVLVPLLLVVDEDQDSDVRSRPAPPSAAAGRGAAAAPDPAVEHDEGQHDLLDPAVLAAETQLAGAGLTPEERLKQAFPGAEEV
jgi:DNA polymerase-3 subunit gamma/tau